MPKNVETCYDDFSDCGNLLDISPRYCAYHSSFNISGHGLTLWANEPYIGISLGHCASGSTPSPNADDADHEINPLSHEHNETITDPTGGGWFDVNGTGENGDKCNFNFGTAIGSNVNGAYNQLINGNPYEIQQEWSNASTGCALTYGAVAPTASFTFSPPSPKALDTVSFDGTGSHSNNTGGSITAYSWNFGDGGVASSATPTHAYAAPGSYTVTLKVTDDVALTDTTTQTVTVTQRATNLAYNGATSGDFNDAVTLKATLTDAATSGALSGKPVVFTLGSQTCSGSTDVLGNASCTLTITQDPGSVGTVSAAFAGDSTYLSSSASSPFSITKEETTTSYTGPTVILQGGSGVTLSAHLVQDGANDADGDPGSAPVAGRSVTLSLGAQSCVGVTDVSGSASCTLVFTGTLGPEPLSAAFAGDTQYSASSDASKTAIVLAFPKHGAFVIGDVNNVPGGSVTFFSERWRKLNTLSGGRVPDDFAGFVPSASPPACGSGWTVSHEHEHGHDSFGPPSTVPKYMGTIVSSSIKEGKHESIVGDTVSIVVVKVTAYHGDEDEAKGTGTVVATFCP